MSDKNNVMVERFQELVRNSGKTRQAIAQDIGCDTSTVTKQFNGDMKISVDYLVKYARYFGVSADYLLGLQKEPTTDKNLNFVCEYTGLNDKAVQALQLSSSKEIKEIINFFLSDSGYADFYELCCSMVSLPFYYNFLANYRKHITEMSNNKELSLDKDDFSEDIDEYFANQEYMDLRNFHIKEALSNLTSLYCGDSLERYRRAGSQLELSQLRYKRDISERKFWQDIKERQERGEQTPAIMGDEFNSDEDW